MNQQEVNCTLEAAKTLNFNRAAENLYLSQPTLSHHIKTLENELGFQIFIRNGRNISLSDPGKLFCQGLREIDADLKRLIEQCQNFSNAYQESIRVSLFTRSAVKYLPQAMQIFSQQATEVYVEPIFDQSANRLDHFLAGQSDILLVRDQEIKNMRQLVAYPLYESVVKLVVKRDDPLTKLSVVTPADLTGRTLLVGGGSPRELCALQDEVTSHHNIKTMISHDHATTLTRVAAGQAVCLSPDLYQDDDPNFIWLNFQPTIQMPYSLVVKQGVSQKVTDFVQVLRRLYQA